VTAPHDQLAAYVDGELPAAEAEAFELHLAGCAACRGALHDALQLVAIEAGAPARAQRSPAAVGAPIHRRPLARRPAVLVAAAAVILVGIAAGVRRMLRVPDAPPAPIALALAPDRAIEGRVSYPAADRHRPYRVARAGAAPAERIGFEPLAELEHRGDLHGVAAVSLLRGDPVRATDYLDRAAPSLDVAADRALVLLAEGHPRDALIALDRVLDAAPRHPQALWNRALALRDLGLPLVAAEAFDAVAALHEPGWADEAAARARQLAGDVRERRAAFRRLAVDDGPRLATAGDAITPGTARRFPGMARLWLYDGVRAATTAAAVRALAPLAHALDEVQGGDALTAYVERIARADFAVRAPLARRYAEVVAGNPLDDAGAARLRSALRAAHADDILLGAIFRLAPGRHVDGSLIPELRRLADASADPWLHLFALERAADTLIQAGDHAAAEPIALAALTACEATRLDYRCAALALTLAESYFLTNRLSDAQRVLDAHVGRTRRGGEWYLEQRFLVQFAEIAMLSDDVAGSTLPVVRAYVRERTLGEPERCDVAAWGSELIAMLRVNRLDLAAARTELARAGAILAACPDAAPDGELSRSGENLFVTAHVLRDPGAGSAEDVARARRQIAHARDSAGPGMQAMLDHIEGRLMLDRDRAAGTALLERAIARADALTRGEANASRARAYAYSLLALDAGRAGEWDRVWELLGRAARSSVPGRCTVGVAVEDGARVVVARGPDGTSHGAFTAAVPGAGPAIDAQHLISPALRDALRDCPEIDVVARPPVQGLAELLPADVAWSYRLDETAPEPHAGAAATAPGAPRSLRVVIANAQPPAALGLAPLSPWRSTEAPDVRLEGAEATPSRALAELAGATFVEIHSHGVMDASGAGASFLTLSPDSDGRYALTAAAIRRQPLRGHPVVILAACHAASTATYRHEAWSLPAALLAAGARAVIASTDIIDDDAAGALFDDVRGRIERGASPAIALRDARRALLDRAPGAAWPRGLMVFH
jgi:hypothetical protein